MTKTAASHSHSKTRIFLTLALLPALALRLGTLATTGLWYDEAYCWWVSTAVPLSKTVELANRELIPPVYYFFLRLWIPLAGDSEFALRLPSALMGLLAVAAAVRLVRTLTRQNLAAFAALILFSIAPPLLWAAHEVRMYGPLLTWTLLSGAALVEVVQNTTPRRQKRWAWIWAAATLASLYHLVLVGFWLLGQGLFALYALARQGQTALRRGILTLLGPALTIVILYAPWAWTALHSLSHNATYWAGHLPIAYFAEITVRGILLIEHFPPENAAGISAAVLLLIVLSLLLARYRPLAAFYPICYALPLGLLAYLFLNMPKWGSQHTTLFAPAPYLALAVAWGSAGAAASRRKPLFLALLIPGTLLILAPILIADYNLLIPSEYSYADWRGAARYVQEHRAPGEVVIIETGSVYQTWLYYDRNATLIPLPPDELLNVDHVVNYYDAAAGLNQGLQEATGVWWIGWLDTVTDPTEVVTTLLEELGPETDALPTFHDLKLRHFTLKQTAEFPAEPPTTARPNQTLLPDLQLWGYELPTPPHPIDQPLELRAWWTTSNPATHIAHFYMALFTLNDAAGTRRAQIDTPAANGDFRPEHWSTGIPVLGRYQLVLPDDLPLGIYTPTLTLYAPGVGEGSYPLPPITITHPLQPPAVPESASPVTATGKTGPIKLLAVQLNSTLVTPCGEVAGRLYWEAEQTVTTSYRTAVTLDNYAAQIDLPVPPDGPWQPGDRWITHFNFTIPCRAPDLKTALQIELLDDATATTGIGWQGPHIDIQGNRNFTPPDIRLPVEANFGPDFANLIGYRLDPPQLTANQPFTLTLTWRAGTTPDIPYSIFVHVVPADNPAAIPIAQNDSWPAQGTRPTHTWLPGEYILDSHPLPALPAGRYLLRIGLYAGDQRLPISMPTGAPADNALELPLDIEEK